MSNLANQNHVETTHYPISVIEEIEGYTQINLKAERGVYVRVGGCWLLFAQVLTI